MFKTLRKLSIRFLSNFSIYQLLKIVSLGHLDEEAIVCNESHISRRKLLADIEKIAKVLLGMEVEKGDTILVATNRSCYENIELFFAANRIGAKISFLDRGYSDMMILDYLNLFGAKVLVHDGRSEESIRGIREGALALENVLDLGNFDLLDGMAEDFSGKVPSEVFGGDNDALITFTSGSTSGPKPMLFTNRALISEALMAKYATGIQAYDKVLKRWLSYVKFDCPYGLWMSVISPILGGACACLTPDIVPEKMVDAEATREIFTRYFVDAKPNIICGIPMLLGGDLEKNLPEDCDLSHVKIFISGGERLEEADVWKGRKFFAQHGAMDLKIRNGYGVGEVLGCVAIGFGAGNATESVGKIVDGVRAVVLDSETDEILPVGATGMLYVGGPHLMKEYVGRPELTAEKIRVINGKRYVLTGDLARIDQKNRIVLVGRASFYINNLPAKVYYEVVRAAVETSPDVLKVYVVKMPDEKYRFRPIAFVVPKPGVFRTLETEAKIIDHSHLPFRIGEKEMQLKEYEIPKKVVFLDDFPRTRQEKINFRELEKLAEEL